MISQTRKISGFTIVELMIAMLLGLIAVGILGVAVQSQFKTASTNRALSKIQNQGKFAIDELATAIHSAGYRGCATATNFIPYMPLRVDAVATQRTSFQPIRTFKITTTGWLPEKPEHYASYVPPSSGIGRPIENTHAILLEGGTSAGVQLSSNAVGPNTIEVSGIAAGLTQGSMALISDCAKAEALFIDSQHKITDTLWAIDSKSILREFYEITANSAGGTRLIPYRRALYYIGDSGRKTKTGKTIRSLFEHLYPFADFDPQEIVEGIEALAITQRQQQDDGTIKEYRAGDLSASDSSSLSLKLSVLSSTPVQYAVDNSSQIYLMSGIEASTNTSSEISYEDDNRLRILYEQSINVRNNVIQVP